MKKKKTAVSAAQGKRTLVLLIIILLIALFAFGAVQLFNVVDVRYPWLWMYLADQLKPNPTHDVHGTKHVMFAFADHFEPHNQETVERWMKSYPLMAEKHRDSDGKMPQHSFFWYFSQSDVPEKKSFLNQISKLAYEGYGEIELHMHHGNDTEESFRKRMVEAIHLSQEAGGMITWEAKPETAFGFIHGMWSLDNSRGNGMCGVNNELIVLRELGCYADFTHPSWGPMHPRVVNRIYYAIDDPVRPHSDAMGTEMEVGKPGLGDLLLFEGASAVHFHGIRPVYDHGEVAENELPTPERVDRWIRAGVHVKGRPDWIFIKVFAHGAISGDHDAVLGKWSDKMYSYLEQKYNDGTNYVLHYVNAREAYNIAKAAEAGKAGNPNDFRDFLIAPYVNRFLWASAPYETISAGGHVAVIKFPKEVPNRIDLRLKGKHVTVSGNAKVVSLVEREDETLITLALEKERIVGLDLGGNAS